MRSARAFAPVLAFAVLAVVVFVLPSFISAFRAQQFAYVAIHLLALIGLNILTGYTGQISLGHGAFMAVGGYTTAILMSDHGVKDVWTIPIAALVAGVVGFLFGIPALRLSGLYLALATFAIGQFQAEHGMLMAGSVILVVPVLIVFVLLQRWITEGIATTGLKG